MLLFSHIPKTAGTSLRQLTDNHTPEVVYAYDGQLALGNPNLAFIQAFRQRSRPALLMGHFSYGVHRLLGLMPRYVTVLREPVERVVSLYRYQKSLPNSPFAAHFGQGMTLRAFVTSGITEMTNNHMCRIAAGVPPDAGMVITDRWLLGYALHNMRRHYTLVGFQDTLAEFVEAFTSLLDWPRSAMPHVNVTPGPMVQIDAATRDAILEHNELDVELYDAMRRVTSASRRDSQTGQYFGHRRSADT
jgi:hypothetical protein